jgi:hypothetical protein
VQAAEVHAFGVDARRDDVEKVFNSIPQKGIERYL